MSQHKIAVFNHSPEILTSFRAFLEQHDFVVRTYIQGTSDVPLFDDGSPT